MKTIEGNSREEFTELFIPKDKEEIIKHFIKCMSYKLGDINDTIVKVSADCYPKEKALGGMIKVQLVQAFNLLVQLEQAIDEPEGSSCEINPYLLKGKELEKTEQQRCAI